MAILLVLLGGVLPLLITPGLFFHYETTPKVIILATVAAAALLRKRGLGEDARALWLRRSGRMVACLAAAEVIWFAVATAASSRPVFSLLGSSWRQFGLITVLILMIGAVLISAHLSRCPENSRLLLRILTTAGLIASVYGIAQYFDLDPFQSAAGYQAHAGDSVIVRPPGTLGHADYFGWWLAIEFFCAIAVIKTDSSFWRIVGIATAAGTGIATVLTGTRAALLAILAGAVALAFLERPRIRARAIPATALVTGVLAVFFFSSPGTRLRARIVWSGDEPTGGARPLLWRDSLRMAAARPLVGFGPETYPSAFAPYESEELAHLYPDFHHESPHNVALDALTSAGVPALLLAFAWAGVAVYISAAALRGRSPIAAPLAAALVASGTASMFSSAILAPLLLTLLVISILVAAQTPDPRVSSRINPLTSLLIGSPVAACLIIFAALLATSDFKLARFERHPSVALYESMGHSPVSLAAEDVYCSRMLARTSSEAGTASARFACWRTALRAAARAGTTADDPANAWYNLALFSAVQNDTAGTRTALVKASQIAPNWFKPHWALATLLSQNGDLSQARSEAERAASLDANRNTEVSQTLLRLKSGTK